MRWLQWKQTLKEVERVGAKFWEVREFERIPGVGPIAAHVFSAIIEEPDRFHTKFSSGNTASSASPIAPAMTNR